MNVSQLYIDIIKGHVNEFMGKHKSLSESRLEICRVCPIYKVDKTYGEICNSKLYLNPKTNEVAWKATPGFIKGCGCRLQAKTTLESNHCIAGKW